jgi:hypothetical protein
MLDVRRIYKSPRLKGLPDEASITACVSGHNL